MISRDMHVVFDDLSALCKSPGYLHVLACIIFRNSYRLITDNWTEEQTKNSYFQETVSRQETPFLISLCLAGEMDLTFPPPETFLLYLEQTVELLKELHLSYLNPFRINDSFSPERDMDPRLHDFEMLKEVVNYGGESAFYFQYTEFSKKKYMFDDEWLIENRGFSIKDLVHFFHCLTNIIRSNLETPCEYPAFGLFKFCFTEAEISEKTNFSVKKTRRILDAFLSHCHDKQSFNLTSPFQMNCTNFNPIIKLNETLYILFEFYYFAQSIYESPFYWMCSDQSYSEKALKHRGDFTESIVYEKMCAVFGKNNVFKNVELYLKKGTRCSEIDVLVIFGSQIIIFQTKSKRFTQKSREGDKKSVEEDFRKAVENAYVQGVLCADVIKRDDVTLLHNKSKITIAFPVSTVYIVCALPDHYPALRFQVSHLLTPKINPNYPPLVVDIFALDVMEKSLASPIYFLLYLKVRASLYHKIESANELTILSYYLNGFHSRRFEECDGIVIEEPCSNKLNTAMDIMYNTQSEKLELYGEIKEQKDSWIGKKLIPQIEVQKTDELRELGYFLLSLDMNMFTQISCGLARGSQHHDLSYFDKFQNMGITVHCVSSATDHRIFLLSEHSEIRKYKDKAQKWIAVMLDYSGTILHCSLSKAPYTKSKRLERKLTLFKSKDKQNKMCKEIGRNDRCPCGSGKKYKKCCLGGEQRRFTSWWHLYKGRTSFRAVFE